MFSIDEACPSGGTPIFILPMAKGLLCLNAQEHLFLSEFLVNLLREKYLDMNERRYPIGIQNFESLRKDGYLYVDKTELIYRLANTGRYYFLSRPRRFGKSLLVSTLEAYFQGKKEVFSGLAMERLEKEWLEHPVLHLDLNIEKYDRPESLDHILNDTLTQWERLYGTEESEASFSLRFAGILRRAHERTGQRVAVLVDEYDKPMLQAIGDKELQQAFRSTLKPFYGVLKSMDGHIRFALLTGVTKFGKVSVFSDLNNLEDISMDETYADICGITENELTRYFKEDIHELALTLKTTDENTLARLKENYDGYHFVPHSKGIYNPFSLLNTFKRKAFGSYWFETGTPTYLVELLKHTSYDLSRLSQEETSEEVMNNIYDDDMPIPVIYQSGYLTIKDFDEEFGIYTLGFPNREVAEGFIRFLMPFYTKGTRRVPLSKSRGSSKKSKRGNRTPFLSGCGVSSPALLTNWSGNRNCIIRTCCSSCSG